MTSTNILVENNRGFAGGPISTPIIIPDNHKELHLLEKSSGLIKPCQIINNSGQNEAIWIEDELPADITREYSIEPCDNTDTRVVLNDIPNSKLDISIDGNLVTSYHYGSESFRPYFHPIIGLNKLPVTRGFPMESNIPEESTDHVHHRGLWSAYGEVNQIDNWAEKDTSGRTLHSRFDRIISGPVLGNAVALSRWVSSDLSSTVLDEKREITFYAMSPMKLFDIKLTLSAREKDVKFGDTKEGGFISLRVASSMEVTRGGKIENSRGGIGESEVWGKQAEWCDYSGLVGNSTQGITIMEHTSSFLSPTYWHARDYGLLSANPFGLSVFLGEEHCGDYTLSANNSITFCYRVLVHQGDSKTGNVNSFYESYLNPPIVYSS